jgi:hypothetical protein
MNARASENYLAILRSSSASKSVEIFWADGKNMIFWRKIVFFSHEIPQKFSRLPPLGAIFLSAPPLTLNPGSAPDKGHKCILYG